MFGNNQNIVIDVTSLESTSLLRTGVEVALFTGTCNNLICLKSSADQTVNPVVNLSWNATIGQRYYIVVASTSASTGYYNINIEVGID